MAKRVAAQHAGANAEPKGHVTTVPFASMEVVKVLPGNVLQVRCHSRDYHFHLGSREESERWATNLVALCAAAGHSVTGFMVVPEG